MKRKKKGRVGEGAREKMIDRRLWRNWRERENIWPRSVGRSKSIEGPGGKKRGSSSNKEEEYNNEGAVDFECSNDRERERETGGWVGD